MIIGAPTDYAVSNGQIRLYPYPSPNYNLVIMGVFDQPELDYDDGTSSNAWTNEAQDLIVARAKMLLFRDYFSDNNEAAKAIAAEDQALRKLRARANLALGTGRVRGSW